MREAAVRTSKAAIVMSVMLLHEGEQNVSRLEAVWLPSRGSGDSVEATAARRLNVW